jgi:hypothetical protein
MPGGRSIANIMGMAKRWIVGALVLVLAAGCSSATAGNNQAKWANEKSSAEVAAARRVADHEADTLFAALAPSAVAAGKSDDCSPGTRDMWYDDRYQYVCTSQEVRYVPVDGPLKPVLVKISSVARARGLQPDNVFQVADPVEGFSYDVPHGTINVGWDNPVSALSVYSIASPATSGAPQPVDLRRLAAHHDAVVAVLIVQTYFTIPWPTS